VPAPGPCSWTRRRGGLGVAGALRTNEEEEEGLDGVEEVGEGDVAADEGEDEKKGGEKRCSLTSGVHMSDGPSYRLRPA
jgi:hypothetical protein